MRVKDFCFVLILSSFLHEGFGEEQELATDSNYLVLSEEEKVAVQEFRKKMLPYLKTSYMRKDIYLIRWLRAKDLNIQQAQQMLMENLNWRRKNKMDEIVSEDWSDMEEDYPYENDTYDKKGRPVGTVNLGSWNILKAVISGRMPRLTRYMAKLLEQSADNVIAMQERGRNITQFKILMNLDGFNGIQHTCPPCLPAYTSFIHAIQNYYTGYAHKVILINTPIVFKTVLDVIQPLFTPRTKRILRIFGTNTKQWNDYLDKAIRREERRPEFGGIKFNR